MALIVTAGDLIYDAALALGAVQIDETLTASEQALIMRVWTRLIMSMGLVKANIHTIQPRTYNIISNQADYTLGYDGNASANDITAATAASPTVLTLTSAHGIPVGQTWSVVIQGGEGNWQGINGGWIATSVSANTLSIPVNATTFGSLTGSNVFLQIAGQLDYERPVEITDVNLIYPNNVFVPLYPLQPDQWANINYFDVNSPPLNYWYDNAAPFGLIRLYPKPNENYQLQIYSTQQLIRKAGIPGLFDLTTQLQLAQGYDRYWMYAVAVEISPFFNLDPTPALLALYKDAKDNVTSLNRRSPASISDPALCDRLRQGLYNWKIGQVV